MRACAASGCSNQGRSLCARCKCVRFCSRGCQVAQWPAHKRDCKHMARFNEGEQVTLVGLTDDDVRRAVLPEDAGVGAGEGAADMAFVLELDSLAGQVRPPASWPGNGRVRVRMRFAYKDVPPVDVAVEPRHLAVVGGEVEAGASCWVCLEGAEAGRLRQGCSCRGSAGVVHLPCIVSAAAAQQERLGIDRARGIASPAALFAWGSCTTCKQEWVGSLGLDIARAFAEANRAAGHSRTAGSFYDLVANETLAKLLSRSRRHAEAEDCLRANLAIQLKIHGPKHDVVSHTKFHLASIAQRVGDIPGAVQQYRELVKHNTRAVGADATQTMLAACNLGTCLQLQETPEAAEEALALFRDTHARQVRVLGEQDGDTLHTATALAGALARVQAVNGCAVPAALEESIAILKNTLSVQQRIFGPNHPDTLLTKVLRACVRACVRACRFTRGLSGRELSGRVWAHAGSE